MMYDFAILGGAFNPIHNGHLYIAEEIIARNIAEKVVFMPNGNHPLKTTTKLLSYQARYELIALAIKHNTNFSVSNFDSPEHGINYTYDLIQRLSKYYLLEQYTFLIGYDNALNFSKWYEPEWLLNNVNFTVVSRSSDLSDQSKQIDSRFNVIEIEPYDISSTEIRNLLDKDESIADLVPAQIIKPLATYWKNLKLPPHQ